MRKRREFLRLGLGGLFSLSLSQLYRMRALAAAESGGGKPNAMIVVFLHGGASHLETWDPKPDAPLEYRGPFQTIATQTPGLRFCELLPKQAAISDRFTIVRSMVHTGFCHGIGQQQMFTGHEVREFKPRSEHPEFLSISKPSGTTPQTSSTTTGRRYLRENSRRADHEFRMRYFLVADRMA